MCLIIILAVPSEAAVAIAQSIVKPWNARIERLNSDSLRSQLSPGSIPFTTSRAQCDCDSRLGCKSHDDPDDDFDPAERFENDLQQRRSKIMKKGWSKAKIDRWEEQQRHAHEVKAQSKARERNDTFSLDEWRQLLSGLLASPGVKHVDLIMHMFSGAIDAEIIPQLPTVLHRLQQLDDEAMMQLKWDTMHVITK